MVVSIDNFTDDLNPDLNYDLFLQSVEACPYVTIDEYCKKQSSTTSFSIINYNIRSFNKNFDSFSSSFSAKFLPNIFCLTETWFSDGQVSEIPGYMGFHVTRDGRSGGVSIYVKEGFGSCMLNDLPYASETIEVCSVELNIKQESFVIVGVYRPHSDTINNFNEHFSNFLESPLLRSKSCIILGDLNICLLKDNPHNVDYSNLLFSHHYTPIITKPTHFSQVNGVLPSLLDHIFLNKICSYSCGILELDLTDHLPTFLNLNYDLVDTNEKIKIQFRLINDSTKISFKNLIENFNWNSILNADADIYTENFISALNNLYCKAFPLKTKCINKNRHFNLWITSEIINLLKVKSDYFFLYRAGMITKEENNNFKNKVNKIVKKQKINYSKEVFRKNRDNLKNTWKHINYLLSNNTSSKCIKKIVINNAQFTNDADIAKIFNDYFCSIGANFDAQIPNSTSDPLQFIDNNSSASFWLNPVSDFEVDFVIGNLKNSKQHVNDISISILKENSVFLSSIISNLINTCFLSGTFPKILKRAIILPLFKKGSDSLVSNYRPISLLPPLSKILEKCLKMRLLDFIKDNNTINLSQFGFQSGISTQDAIIHSVEKMYSNFNDKLSSIGIYIDFSKAFDTLNIRIL